jgi:glutathione S-transferase
MALKHLKVPFELVEVNFNEGAHLTEEYAKVRSMEIDEIVET